MTYVKIESDLLRELSCSESQNLRMWRSSKSRCAGQESISSRLYSEAVRQNSGEILRCDDVDPQAQEAHGQSLAREKAMPKGKAKEKGTLLVNV